MLVYGLVWPWMGIVDSMIQVVNLALSRQARRETLVRSRPCLALALGIPVSCMGHFGLTRNEHR